LATDTDIIIHIIVIITTLGIMDMTLITTVDIMDIIIGIHIVAIIIHIMVGIITRQGTMGIIIMDILNHMDIDMPPEAHWVGIKAIIDHIIRPIVVVISDPQQRVKRMS